jgi:hypothetical protein
MKGDNKKIDGVSFSSDLSNILGISTLDVKARHKLSQKMNSEDSLFGFISITNRS